MDIPKYTKNIRAAPNLKITAFICSWGLRVEPIAIQGIHSYSQAWKIKKKSNKISAESKHYIPLASQVVPLASSMLLRVLGVICGSDHWGTPIVLFSVRGQSALELGRGVELCSVAPGVFCHSRRFICAHIDRLMDLVLEIVGNNYV